MHLYPLKMRLHSSTHTEYSCTFPVASFTPPPNIFVDVLGAGADGVDERVLPVELGIPDFRITVPFSHDEALDLDILSSPSLQPESVKADSACYEARLYT